MILYGEIAVNIIYAIFGVLLFIWPTMSLDVIRVSFGLLMLVTSIYQLIKYVMRSAKKGPYIFDLYFGIVGIVLSLLLLFQPIVITNIVVLFLSIWFIVQGILKSIYGVKLLKKKEEIAPLIIACAASFIIAGLFILIFPNMILVNLTKGIGLFIIIYAVIDIMQDVLFIKRAKALLKLFK